MDLSSADTKCATRHTPDGDLSGAPGWADELAAGGGGELAPSEAVGSLHRDGGPEPGKVPSAPRVEGSNPVRRASDVKRLQDAWSPLSRRLGTTSAQPLFRAFRALAWLWFRHAPGCVACGGSLRVATDRPDQERESTGAPLTGEGAMT